MLETVASDRLLSFTVSRVSQDREFRARLRKVLPEKMKIIFGFPVFVETLICMDLLKNMEWACTCSNKIQMILVGRPVEMNCVDDEIYRVL
jgi:hypothetical protein